MTTITQRVTAIPSGGQSSRVSGTITASNSERVTQQAGMDFLALEGDQADGVLLLEGDQASGVLYRLQLEGDQGAASSSYYTQRIGEPVA